MRRRDFLRSTGLVTSGLLAPRFLHGMVGALPLGGRKLVVVQLTGGNDGLNTIVPLQNDDYHRLRPKLALAPGVALPVSDGLGLNPGMEAIRRLFDDGRVCVINGVGYPDPDHSHFRSMDIWQTASNSSEYLDTGWLGRYLDARSIAPHDVVEFGGTLSLANKGQRMKAITLTDPARFFQATREPWFAQLASVRHEEEHRELGLLYRTMVETYRSAGYIQEHLRPRTTGITYPKGAFAKQLQHVSAFIQSGMDTSVYYTSTGGFDTHVNQLVKHQKLWTEVSEGIAAFLNDLRTAGLGKEVLVMVFSEFGRRAKENASNGTDHGTAGSVLLFGEGLRKPGFFNPVPSLSRLDDNGDLVFSTDFRRIYATVLKDWLDTDPGTVIAGRFEKIPVLG